MPVFKHTTPGMAPMRMPILRHVQHDSVWVKKNTRLEVNEELPKLLLQELLKVGQQPQQPPTPTRDNRSDATTPKKYKK